MGDNLCRLPEAFGTQFTLNATTHQSTYRTQIAAERTVCNGLVAINRPCVHRLAVADFSLGRIVADPDIAFSDLYQGKPVP